jgi:hypothetical protein
MDRLQALGHDVNKLIPDLYYHPAQRPRKTCTVLHYVCDNFRPLEVTVLQKLLQLGADPDIHDGKGRTALATVFYNCLQRHVLTESVKTLLYYNATPDLVLEVEQVENMPEYTHGYTTVSPLIVSVLVGSRKAVDLLLDAGYNVHREDLNRYPTDDKFKHLVDVIANRKSAPDPLTTLCRTSLRRQYRGHRIFGVMNTVQFPEKLRNFVLLKDIQ